MPDRKGKSSNAYARWPTPAVRNAPELSRRVARRSHDARAHDCPLHGTGSDDRFASGAELAEQLDGCRRLASGRAAVAATAGHAAARLRRPFLWLVVLVILPQMAGSIVNIAYNWTQIVDQLDDAQKDLFDKLVVGYNVIVYPIGIAMLVSAVLPVWRCWRALARAEHLPVGEVGAARRKALAAAAMGRDPHGDRLVSRRILVPAADRDFRAAIWNRMIAAHFIASFCLSGLIALGVFALRRRVCRAASALPGHVAKCPRFRRHGAPRARAGRDAPALDPTTGRGDSALGRDGDVLVLGGEVG